MEDRWFIFLEDEWLYFYRSWSGYCVYGARLTKKSTGALLNDAWVNADKDQYELSEPAEEKKFLETLISNILLNKNC